MSSPNESWASTLLGSACSGLIGRIVCHPFDTCKARLQSPLNFDSSMTLLSVIKTTFKEEGVLGFYRGLGGVLVGGIPGTCVYLSTYEESKKVLSNAPGISSSPFAIYLTSGMIAETICCIIFVPIDVIKNRMQLQRINTYGKIIAYPGQPVYSGSFDACYKIYKSEGLKGLYKGYGSTLLSFGPFSAIYFLLYEETKRLCADYFQVNKSSLPLQYSLPCSVVAGSLSAFITNPLDLAKLRIQVQGTSNDLNSSISNPLSNPSSTIINTTSHNMKQQISKNISSNNKSFLEILLHVYQQKGIWGLYRGAGARVLFHAPSTALTVALFEDFRRWWSRFM